MTDLATMMRNLAPETMETEERICSCGSLFTVDRLHGGHRYQCPQCSIDNNATRARNNYKKTGNRWSGNPVVVVGYVKVEGVPDDDYRDYYTGQEFPFMEVEYMVKMGSFTPGIVLYREGAQKVIVIGEGENQELRVL
jgi:hypothetical protein